MGFAIETREEVHELQECIEREELYHWEELTRKAARYFHTGQGISDSVGAGWEKDDIKWGTMR